MCHNFEDKCHNLSYLRVVRVQADTATTSTVTISPYHCFPRYQRMPQRRLMLRSSSQTMSMTFSKLPLIPDHFHHSFFIYIAVLHNALTLGESLYLMSNIFILFEEAIYSFTNTQNTTVLVKKKSHFKL